ncbi:MAG: PEGA domain-containing protein [Bacteroidales bacterium]
MKRFYLLLFAILLFSHCIYAQSLSVSSFRKLDNSMTARIDAPKKDKNGDVCAVIKIVTSQTGFTFEGDGAGIFGSEYKNGEYWVWVGYGANRLTIKHSQLGVLRDYIYPISIQKASDYELVLITGKIVTTLVEEIESKWLLITSTPKNAMIYLDNVFAGIGTAQKKLKPGKYEYRIEAPFYHNAVGKIEIKEENVTQSIQLQAAFGFLQISSLPEDGATIMIDGKQINTNTPAKTDTLMSGEHLVTIAKQMFQPSSQKVMIKDNETTPITLTMLPNFAEVEITAPNDATIWIDNNNKATGLWQGRLDAGIYTIEARKDKHITHKKDIEAKAGEKLNIALNPTPQYGKLDIVTEPPMAIITINGKNYGTTPNTIKDLLIGDYTVELSLVGYATAIVKASITEGQTATINATLTNGREVNINSIPSGVDLYIDNNKVGLTPYKGNITFGNHTIRIEQSEKKAEKNINIAQSGGETNFVLSFVETVTDFDGNVYHTIKIGTQVWLKENLKTTHYRNGDAIPNVTDNTTWSNLNTAAYCNYNNKASNGTIYGRLYNWYTVNTGNLCPTGWHVPSGAEWTTLTNYLGGKAIAGGKLKEAGLNHWISPNTEATNETGFAALPGGYRYGAFFYFGDNGHWWSSTEINTSDAECRYMYYNYSDVGRSYRDEHYGFSVRCLRD